jgi:hypothetical protein
MVGVDNISLELGPDRTRSSSSMSWLFPFYEDA